MAEEKKKKNQVKKGKTNSHKKTRTKKDPNKKTTTTKKNLPKKRIEKKPEEKKILESTILPPNLEKTVIFNKEQTKNIKEVFDTIETAPEKKKENVEKKEKWILLILILLLGITIIVGTIYIAIAIQKENEPNTINSNIYKKVLENSKKVDFDTSKNIEVENTYETIISLNLSEFEKKIISKEDMAILISKKTCYYCLSFEETIDKVLKEKQKKIYKLDITDMSKEELNRLREYYRFTITPTIFKIEKGIVTNDLIEAQSEENFTNWVEENL